MIAIADDFGLSRAHDQVILWLLENGRIDGTSVMVNDHIDPANIAALKGFRANGALVGLHINLTHSFAPRDRTWPLSRLMLPLGKAGRKAAHGEVNRQVRAFERLFGGLPDYYDGHQHCHCLPAIVAATARLPMDEKSWVRLPLPASIRGKWLNIRAGGFKTVPIMLFALWARRTLRSAGLRCNRDFSGFLRLDRPESVRKWLPRLLSQAGADCVVMLHPGACDETLTIPGHDGLSRVAEAEILAGNAPDETA